MPHELDHVVTPGVPAALVSSAQQRNPLNPYRLTDDPCTHCNITAQAPHAMLFPKTVALWGTAVAATSEHGHCIPCCFTNTCFMGACRKRVRHKMDHLVCFVPAMLALGSHMGAVTGSKADQYMQLAENLTETCWQMYATQPTGTTPKPLLACILCCLNVCNPVSDFLQFFLTSADLHSLLLHCV